MIDKCIENDDEERLEEALKYKNAKFDELTLQQLDLIQYGNFSFLDTGKLKVVEKNRFLDIITKRLEAKK